MTKKSNVPAIRFKDFTDTWEQRKFSELTEIRSASRVHKEEWEYHFIGQVMLWLH